ncbi:MAG TPA: hypothetical protein VIS99_10300, partial [Terrimicrobiaceae bacterium]
MAQEQLVAPLPYAGRRQDSSRSLSTREKRYRAEDLCRLVCSFQTCSRFLERSSPRTTFASIFSGTSLPPESFIPPTGLTSLASYGQSIVLA